MSAIDCNVVSIKCVSNKTVRDSAGRLDTFSGLEVADGNAITSLRFPYTYKYSNGGVTVTGADGNVASFRLNATKYSPSSIKELLEGCNCCATTGSAVLTPSYTQTFVGGSFVIGATESSLTILQATHLKGVNPTVSVWESIGGGVYQQVGVVVQKNATGDITLKVINGATFSGSVTIV